MATAIDNNPKNTTTKSIQKLCQLIKGQFDNAELSVEQRMVAIAEALNDLNYRIDGLQDQNVLPDLVGNSINTQEIPKVGGCSTILTGTSVPSTIPDFIGQIYINTSASKVYVARGNTSSSQWVDVTDGVSTDDCVKITSQSLTDSEKNQAVSNIGTTRVHLLSTVSKAIGDYGAYVLAENGEAVLDSTLVTWFERKDICLYTDNNITYKLEKIAKDGSGNLTNAYFTASDGIDTLYQMNWYPTLGSHYLDYWNYTTALARVVNKTSAPSSTPSKVGIIHINTTNGNVYLSVGTSSSSDWKQIQFV